MHGEVVSKDKLERLADNGHLLLDVEAVGSLENFSDEGSSLEMVVNEVLERSVNVLVKILRQSVKADTLSANIEFLSASLEINGLLVSESRLNPVNGEAAVVSDKDLANHDGQSETVAVGDPHESLLLGESLDIVDRDTTVHVSLVVGLPVLHEITNILNVDTSAGNLPETSMGRLATSAGLSLVTSLLEELASQASSEFSDLAGLLPLLGQERSLSATNLLLNGTILLAIRNTANNTLSGALSNRALAGTRVPAVCAAGRGGYGSGATSGAVTARRGFGLDGNSGNSGGGDGLRAVVVGMGMGVVVAVVGEAVAVVTSIDITIRLGREGGVRERRDLLEASKLHRIGAVGRVGIGSQVKGLGRVKDGSTLSVSLLELIKVGLVPIYHSPSLAR